MLQWKKIIIPNQRLNQISCFFPVAQALHRAALGLGTPPPRPPEHHPLPHFSLLGLFGGPKVGAAHAALKQALTWLRGCRGPTPRATGQEGPGEKISQRSPFAVASWQAEAGSAASTFLRLPATAVSQYRLGLALILPEPDLSFSFLFPSHNKTANIPVLHAASGPQQLCRPHPKLGACCKTTPSSTLVMKTGLRLSEVLKTRRAGADPGKGQDRCWGPAPLQPGCLARSRGQRLRCRMQARRCPSRIR